MAAPVLPGNEGGHDAEEHEDHIHDRGEGERAVVQILDVLHGALRVRDARHVVAGVVDVTNALSAVRADDV